MNLNRVILMPDGTESSLSYPTQKDIDNLPKTPSGNPDFSKMPKDTVKNVILKCLRVSNPKDIEESMMVMLIGQKIVESESGNITLRPKLNNFLIELLKSQIYKETKTPDGKIQGEGIYKGWAIVQVLEELGVKNKIE